MIFKLEDKEYYTGKYLIKADLTQLPFPAGTKGSYQLLPARLLGFDYPTYLRYCRDVIGAELIGRNCKYVIPIFEFNEKTKAFLKVLNSAADLALTYVNRPAAYEMKEGKVIADGE